MSIASIGLIIIGLILFEIVSSIDNAIINAEVLSTMGQKFRRFFLTWGIIIAVVVIRGILPFIIVWATIPNLGFVGALTATFSSDPAVAETIKEAAGLPLALGGVFLVFLFFNWLFLEPKNYGLRGERFFHSQGAWFYTVVSLLLTALVYFGLQKDALLTLGIVIGIKRVHGVYQIQELGYVSVFQDIEGNYFQLIQIIGIDNREKKAKIIN